MSSLLVISVSDDAPSPLCKDAIDVESNRETENNSGVVIFTSPLTVQVYEEVKRKHIEEIDLKTGQGRNTEQTLRYEILDLTEKHQSEAVSALLSSVSYLQLPG